MGMGPEHVGLVVDPAAQLETLAGYLYQAIWDENTIGIRLRKAC